MSGERYAFVLRLWTEADRQDATEERPLAIRGSLHAVENGEVVYFSSLDALLPLIEQFVAQAVASQPPAPGETQNDDTHETK